MTQSSATTWEPPPLAVADLDEFRRTLVGLSDPAPPVEGVAVKESVKRTAAEFCGVLADLYAIGREDRTRVWDHIIKAVKVSAAACDPADWAAFACGCLPPLGVEPESVVGKPGEGFTRLLDTVGSQGEAMAGQLIRYLSGPLLVVAVTTAQRGRKARKPDPSSENASNA